MGGVCLHKAGEIQKHFENYRGRVNLRVTIITLCILRCPGRMHELNTETSCSLPPKMKAGMVRGLKTLTRGATENTGYLGLEKMSRK